MARVVIFHTSDMHDKLNPEQALRLRELKEDSPGSLMLDSGDALRSGNLFWRPGGEPILDLMNGVPYDAMCMGNREFLLLGFGARSKTGQAAFPVLSANLRSRRSGLPVPAKPSIVLEHGGVKIGILGLSIPCVTKRMLVHRIADFYFEQPVAAAAALVPRIRPDCDLLIALTHLGVSQDRELARAVAGIDLILGGHTHTTTEQHERVGGTLIIHDGAYARLVGKLEIEIGQSGIAAIRREIIPLGKA